MSGKVICDICGSECDKYVKHKGKKICIPCMTAIRNLELANE